MRSMAEPGQDATAAGRGEEGGGKLLGEGLHASLVPRRRQYHRPCRDRRDYGRRPPRYEARLWRTESPAAGRRNPHAGAHALEGWRDGGMEGWRESKPRGTKGLGPFLAVGRIPGAQALLIARAPGGMDGEALAAAHQRGRCEYPGLFWPTHWFTECHSEELLAALAGRGCPHLLTPTTALQGTVRCTRASACRW